MILTPTLPAPCHSAPDDVTSKPAKAEPLKETWADNEPGLYDVLCNRGRRAFQSIGNRRFRLIIENHSAKYDAMKVRAERSMMVISIVKVIESAGGNFLKQRKDGTWEKATKVQAKEKVGHALRAALTARRTQTVRTIYDVLAVDEQELNQHEVIMPQKKKLRTLTGSAPAPNALSLGEALVMANETQQVDQEEITSSSCISALPIMPAPQDNLNDIFSMDICPPSDASIYSEVKALDDNLAEVTDDLLSGILDELDALVDNENIFGDC